MAGLIFGKAIDWGSKNAIYVDTSFNGSETTKNIDVSAKVNDARKFVAQLLDSNYERIFCTVKATSATNIQVVTGVPLPSATYRLILA